MRLLFVSGGIMMLGLIAVFAAIVYKLSAGAPAGPSPPALSAAAPAEGSLAVPAGHRLVNASLDGDRALLSLEGPDGSIVLVLVDLATGAELARRTLVDE